MPYKDPEKERENARKRHERRKQKHRLATTRAARVAQAKPSAKTRDRMLIIERLLGEGHSERDVIVRCAAEWGLKEDRVRDIVSTVYAAWAAESDHHGRPQRRTAQREKLKRLIILARSRTKNVSVTESVETDDGRAVMVTRYQEVPSPDHQAIARYMDMLNRLDGLYQDKLEVEQTNGGLVDALALAARRMRAGGST